MSQTTANIQQPLNNTLKLIFTNLTDGPKQKNARLIEKWNRLVGEEVSKKTTPRFHTSSVVIWVENSALACELSQRWGDIILKRLQNEFGEKEVRRVWFSVGKPRF